MLAAALGFGACGGDDDSASTGTAAPTQTSATASTPSETPQKSAGTTETDSGAQVPSPGAVSPKPGGKDDFSRAETRAYYVARRACLKQGASTLAGRYGIDSGDRSAIAGAYAQRAFGPKVRRAAARGCLVGFR